MSNLAILEKNGKFVVTKNGEPIVLPKTEGQSIVTEFSSKDDAIRYMDILNKLSLQKKYRRNSHAS